MYSLSGMPSTPFRNATVPTMRGMAEDIRATLWTNVRALMVKTYGNENLNRLAREAKIGPATAQRIKTAKQYVRLDSIEKVAKHFKVEPWQLITNGTADEKFLEVLALWRDTDARGRRMIMSAVRGAAHDEDAEQRERPVLRKAER